MNINKIILSLLLKKPFYGYILSNMNIVESKSINRIKTVPGATIQLVYNRDWLESLEEIKVYGNILHELLHLIFLHSFRRGARDQKLWAIATDIAVNEHINADMLPEGSITVRKANRALALKMEPYKSADYYYEMIKEVELPPANLFLMNQNKLILRLPGEDEILINLEEEQDDSDLNEKAAKVKLEEIMRQTQVEGEIPAELIIPIGAVYSSVNVNWRKILKQFLTGKGKMRIHKTVKRVSKRFADFPGNKRHKGVRALIAIDESGSINSEDVLSFYKELRTLKSSIKAELHVTRFDTDCTRTVPIEKYLKSTDRAKNGGTDFRPIFELAEKSQFRFVIIFTDGDGIMPQSVKQNVLWILTKNNEINPNLGKSVVFQGV